VAFGMSGVKGAPDPPDDAAIAATDGNSLAAAFPSDKQVSGAHACARQCARPEPKDAVRAFRRRARCAEICQGSNSPAREATRDESERFHADVAAAG